MNYQLPNGKVIYLSIEEFLALTDDDLQYLIARDYGEVISNPFSGSAVDTKKKPDESREFLDSTDDDFPNLDIDITDLF